ncbi:MAG: NYN domain-containing protein [Leptospirales bacterium]
MKKKTAILVDGSFFYRRSKKLFGIQKPEILAEFFWNGCNKLLESPGINSEDPKELYRVLFYDCPFPDLDRLESNSLLWKIKKDFGEDQQRTRTDFFNFISRKGTRKFAARNGFLDFRNIKLCLRPEKMTQLNFCNEKSFEITFDDIIASPTQKGVDMRIGLDIAELSYGRLVDQIILVSGDSDFVPAAKMSRRLGVDFVLDPMGDHVKKELTSHVDGVVYNLWTGSLFPKKVYNRATATTSFGQKGEKQSVAASVTVNH